MALFRTLKKMWHLKADNQTRHSARQKILLPMGRRKRATVDRVEGGRGGSGGKVESTNWSSVFKG